MFHPIAYTLAFFTSFDNPLVLIVVVFFGILLFGKRLPDIGKNVGKTIVEFKKGLSSAKNEIEEGVKEEPEPEPSARPVVTAKAAPRSIKQISAVSDEP